MKSRFALMSGGAVLLLLTAMPVFAEETTGAPVASDVVTESWENLDPFAADSGFEPFSSKQIRPERARSVRQTMRLRAEVWEVSSIELVRALDAGTSAETIQKWRSGLLEEGTLAFTSILNLDSGYEGSAESITEYIYPTEYEPGEVLPPADAASDGSDPAEPASDAPTTTPTTPTAFETRNTGTTLEASLKPVEVVDNTWDLLFELETVLPTGFTELGDPELHIRMPSFTTFRVSGLARLKEAEWQLAASQPAPLGTKNEAAGKSWVTLIRIDRAR